MRTPSYPAAYEQVIAVTAVDKNLRGYIHANHGDYIDVAAPGVGIWTALPGVLEGYQSGTSFAAPHVTAILAAVHDRVEDKSKEGFLKALAIRDLGQAGRDRIYGQGLVLAPKWVFIGKRARRLGHRRRACPDHVFAAASLQSHQQLQVGPRSSRTLTTHVSGDFVQPRVAFGM